MRAHLHLGRQDTAILPLWFVWLAALSFVFYGVGSFAILDNNEGLYAEVAREMLAAPDSRGWIIPHLNGLPYMEKPPLLYWLTGLSFSVFGITEWSARLVPALSTLACVGQLIWFGTLLQRPQAGRLAALMFVSGVGMLAMSHVLMFDMLLTCLLTASLLCGWQSLLTRDGKYLRRAYFFLGFAVLAKGLIALVLFGLVMGGACIAYAGSGRSAWSNLLACVNRSACLIFVLVTLPWHLAATLVEPTFAQYYFIQEHVLRFLGLRIPHDYYPGTWWYYLPRMALYLFPWSVLLPCLLIWRSRSVHPGGRSLSIFLGCAWLLPLVFFSVSSAKANYYLVVVMPLAAMHLAIALEDRPQMHAMGRALPGVLLALASGIGVVSLTWWTAAPTESLIIHGLPRLQFTLLAVGVFGILSVGAAIIAWRIPRIGVLAYALLSGWIVLMLLPVLQAMEPTISTRLTAQYLQTGLPGRRVYLYRDFDQQSSLAFYLQRPLAIIDVRSSDLFWGQRLQKSALLLSQDEFVRRLPSEAVAVVVMDRQVRDFRAAPFFSVFKTEKRLGETTIFTN